MAGVTHRALPLLANIAFIHTKYSPIRTIFIHFLSVYSAEMEPRIEIFTLKLVGGNIFVLFGRPGYELQRFENLVFSMNLYGSIWNLRHVPHKCIVKTKS